MHFNPTTNLHLRLQFMGIYWHLLLHIQCPRRIKQAHLHILFMSIKEQEQQHWLIIGEGCRHKVNLCNFPVGKMTSPWVILYKYSNDPEYMQSIISDYSARGRGNKLINASHHNRVDVYHTSTQSGMRALG